MIQLPIITKIVLISALYLNAPYQKLNCQEYVEAVLSRAVSTHEGEVPKNLEAIQYSKTPDSYFTRNHFPAADWIPNNIHKKFLTYSPLNTKVISKVENKVAWCETQLHDPSVCNEHFKKTWVVLRYIPIAKLPAVESEIPNGSILFMVKPTKYTLISHMGFAIQKNHELFLRAASSLAGKVTDYNLDEYLRFEKRTVGITVLVPQEQGQEPNDSQPSSGESTGREQQQNASHTQHDLT